LVLIKSEYDVESRVSKDPHFPVISFLPIHIQSIGVNLERCVLGNFLIFFGGKNKEGKKQNTSQPMFKA
jgi:hypothetical protein